MKLLPKQAFLLWLGLCSWLGLAFYVIYFAIARWVYAFNKPLDATEICPHLQVYFKERDGIECYVLYALTLLFACIAALLAKRLNSNGSSNIAEAGLGEVRLRGYVYLVSIQSGSFLLFALFLLGYFAGVGFLPPVPFQTMICRDYLLAILAVGAMLGYLLIVGYFRPNWILSAACLIMLPLCFVTQEGLTLQDYNYIWGPGLCIAQNQAWHSIYFQYDVLLSLLAALWMKLHWDLNTFQLIGQFSMLLLFMGCLYWGRNYWGKNRIGFAAFFFVTLLLVRYFSLYCEMSSTLQTSPARLDWWLAVLLLAQSKGSKHWTMGLLLGFLYVFHRNFGLIYTAAYLQWLLFLLVVDLKQHGGFMKISNLKEITCAFAKAHIVPLALIVAAVLISVGLFRGFAPESAVLYQGVGIGMIRISHFSFFWIVLPLILLAPLLAFVRFRQGQLSWFKLQQMTLLFLLCCGNLLYFFGRSHENNLLHVSAPICLLLFATLSLLPMHWNKYLLPLLLLLVLAYSGPHLRMKLGLKAINLFRYHHLIQPIVGDVTPNDIAEVKELANGSSKIYLLDFKKEVLLNYYCGYKCLGHFQPSTAWFYEPDRRLFLKVLLNEGYSIISSDSSTLKQAIEPLMVSRSMQWVKSNHFWKVYQEKAD